jgi:hypothetical protein
MAGERSLLSDVDRRALARLADAHPDLSVGGAYRSEYDGTICGVHHRGATAGELFGNRTVRQVREMVEAIERA